MSFISQFTRQSRSYIYHRVYKGPFEYKKKDTQMSQYPFVNHNDLQKKFKEIHEIRSRKLNDEDVSPFHLVWRYKSFYGNHWLDFNFDLNQKSNTYFIIEIVLGR